MTLTVRAGERPKPVSRSSYLNDPELAKAVLTEFRFAGLTAQQAAARLAEDGAGRFSITLTVPS